MTIETPEMTQEVDLMKGTKRMERSVEDSVRYIYTLLREKEIAIERVRREIEALRLACPLLCDESDFASNGFESGIQTEPKTGVVRLADETDASPIEINPSPVDAEPEDVTKANEKNALLQFGQVALDASRTLLKRVLDNHFVEREPQRKTVRELFEWLGRSNAA